MRGARAFILSLAATMAATTLRAEKISTKTFPEGLTWIHKPVGHNRIVAFHLFFPGGSVTESAADAGITRLMGSVMFKGTRSRSALRIAQETESLGASLGAAAAEDYWEMSAQTTDVNFGPAFDVFQDILLNPSFPPEEFEKERRSALNDIRSKKEHIFEVAHDLFQKELFKAHPYGLPEEGTEASVSSLTPEALRRWHERRTRPAGAVFVTVGCVPRAEIEKRLRALLAAWAPSSPAAPAPLSGPAPSYPDAPVFLEEKHPFEQSFLMWGFPAPGLTDPDYAAAKALNALLGAGMSSPLFQTVREESGLAYDVSSFFPTRRLGGAFVIYAGTDPKNLDLARDKVAELLERFKRTPPSEEEIAAAKRYILGHYSMEHQTNSRIGWYLGWWEVSGKGHGFDALYPKEIQAVAARDVHRVLMKMFARPSVTVRIRSDKK